MGSDWASWLQSGVVGITFGVPGLTLGGLGSSLIAFGGHLVSIWMTWASKIDAAGDRAGIAKTIENRWFS